MKATDLMIGDWVYIKDEFRGKNFKFAIYGITDDDIFGYSIKNIEPIPLTAEILKKNGFENGQFNNEYYIYGTNFYVVGFDNTYSYQDSDMGFKYVHELQHALRLCGLNEMANNFKI